MTPVRGGGGVALRDLPGCISLVPLPCPRFDSKGLISVLWAFSRLAVEVLPPPPLVSCPPLKLLEWSVGQQVAFSKHHLS